MLLKNSLKFSIYKENITPKKIPKKVAVVPIITPHVGDYSRDLLNAKLGITYYNDIQKLIYDIEVVSNDIIEYRRKLHEYSFKFTWDNYQVS